MLILSKISHVYRITLGMALGLTLFTTAAHADGLVVVPAQLKLSAARPVVDLQVRNSSAEETTYQFEVNSWKQDGERNLLTPDTRLIVHPQSIKLQPGESARIRVGLRLSGPRWNEEAFQVLISETPRIPDVGTRNSYPDGPRTIQRGRVPVFLLPPGKALPRMTWQVERNDEGSVILRARNIGEAHVKLNSATLMGPAGQSIHKGNLSDILLPGGTRSWTSTANLTAGVWLLTADTNAGRMNAKLELGPDLSIAKALSLRD